MGLREHGHGGFHKWAYFKGLKLSLPLLFSRLFIQVTEWAQVSKGEKPHVHFTPANATNKVKLDMSHLDRKVTMMSLR